MTLAPPESSGAPGTEPDDADAGIRPVVRQRVATRKKRRRRAVVVQAVLSVVFVALLVSLAFVGYRSALKITGGRSSEVTDPAAPGYVAEVRPTSVRLIGFTGGPWRPEAAPDTVLAAALLVIQNAPDDVVVVPVSPAMTLRAFEDAPPASAETVFSDGGIDVLKLRLGADLTFGPTATSTVPMSAVEALATQVGPITFQNPDTVTMATMGNQIEARFPAGELTLDPAQVVEFLSMPGHLEDGSNRALRTTALWSELLRLLGEGSGSAPGDESLADFAELVETLTGTEVRDDILPLVPEPSPVGAPEDTQAIDIDAMPNWVSLHVSFPTSAYPGQRATVAILNGTTNDDAPRTLAPRIALAGGEITLLGNADSFDMATSVVEYFSPDARAAAEQIAQELGLTATLVETPGNDVDVEVEVGKDLAP